MSKKILNGLRGNIKWVHLLYGNMVNPLSEEQVCQRPSDIAPPIGWHIWHIARWADMLQASLPGQSELWETENMAAEFGLDPSRLGLLQMGASMSHEEAANVPKIIGKARLMDYATTVFALCDQELRKLNDDDLYTPRKSILKLNFSVDPVTEGEGADVVLVNDLIMHHGHASRHIGMIEGIIGVMFDHEGTATI